MVEEVAEAPAVARPPRRPRVNHPPTRVAVCVSTDRRIPSVAACWTGVHRCNAANSVVPERLHSDCGRHCYTAQAQSAAIGDWLLLRWAGRRDKAALCRTVAVTHLETNGPRSLLITRLFTSIGGKYTAANKQTNTQTHKQRNGGLWHTAETVRRTKSNDGMCL